MKHAITLATAIFAVSAAYAGTFQPWDGEDGISQVNTGLDNGSETSGYWFSYADDGDGGESKVTWPVDTRTETGTSLDSVITHCKGVCGVASLSKGSLKYNPFVGIGFNIVGEGLDGDPEAGDATDWGGICITYTSDIAVDLELGLGAYDATIEYANPVFKLAKASTTPVTKAVPWAKFAQPSWYTGATKISGPEAAKQLVAVKFKIQAVNGDYNFNIKKIAPFTACDPEGSNAIKTIRNVSSAKATLAGRTLNFTGIKSKATVNIINTQGQTVVKGTIDITTASLDLASLDAGVYMVHVNGKNVNFAKKIILK
jgi:hypothetical protein